MSKKILSVVLALAMVVAMACISGASMSAATTDVEESSASQWNGETIYFQAPQEWLTEATPRIFAHIWNTTTGTSVADWQVKAERMKNTGSDNIWSYSVPAGDWNMVIFSSNNALQSYDMTMSTACAGDTAYLTGATCENPVDSQKVCLVSAWKTNNDKYGSHLAKTSIGNIVGEYLLANEINPNTGVAVTEDGKYAGETPTTATTEATETTATTATTEATTAAPTEPTTATTATTEPTTAAPTGNVAGNVYYYLVPEDVPYIIWNSYVDRGTNEEPHPEMEPYAFQSVNINCEFPVEPGDNPDFPAGIPSYNNMIWVANEQVEENPFSGAPCNNGRWYYFNAATCEYSATPIEGAVDAATQLGIEVPDGYMLYFFNAPQAWLSESKSFSFTKTGNVDDSDPTKGTKTVTFDVTPDSVGIYWWSPSMNEIWPGLKANKLGTKPEPTTEATTAVTTAPTAATTTTAANDSSSSTTAKGVVNTADSMTVVTMLVILAAAAGTIVISRRRVHSK